MSGGYIFSKIEVSASGKPIHTREWRDTPDGPATHTETKMKETKIYASSSGTEIDIRLKNNEYEPDTGPGPGWISADISVYQITDAVVSQTISLHNISVEDLERYSRKFKQAADKLRAAVEIDTWPTDDIVIR